MTDETLETIILGHIAKELKDEIQIGRQVTLAKTIMQALRIHAVIPSCEGNCGMNYCDDNGCIERKRVLVEPTDLPEHEA